VCKQVCVTVEWIEAQGASAGGRFDVQKQSFQGQIDLVRGFGLREKEIGIGSSVGAASSMG
jgi:hypothetical protein